MFSNISIIFSLVLSVVFVNAILEVEFENKHPAFDPQFYNDVLDPDLCAEQLEYIYSSNPLLRWHFLDSGLRIPSSVLQGNTNHFGNYHQCLGIDHNDDGVHIEGKYCTVFIQFDDDEALAQLSEVTGLEMVDPEILHLDDDRRHKLIQYERTVNSFNNVPTSRAGFAADFVSVLFRLGVCVPKPCTVREGLTGLYNSSAIGFIFEEETCRLPNDKPWAPVDYVAIVIFSLFGLLALLSTSYDLWKTFKVKENPKLINKTFTIFSLYTNGRRLTTFSHNPKAIDCIDGIRCLSISWVILGHTFSTLPVIVNAIEGLDFMPTLSAQWLMMTHVGVDSFFTISGLLLVYTSVGKLTGKKFLKTLHLFYLNRVLRMFPLLATTILLQASVFHRVADGPRWETVASNTNNCRTHWWLSLLYVQNYINSMTACLGHSWYLAVDTQLYIISPIILYWVLNGRRKEAWIALIAGLLVIVSSATIFSFMMNFTGTLVLPYVFDNFRYRLYFYFNTLTRGSPFFVGMTFGYLLHLYRGKKIHINKFLVFFLWILAAGITTLCVCINYVILNIDNNQLLNNFVNSLQRPLWGLAVSMIIFGCVQGYGGPVNWLLSHPVWKLPSRISYGMYLIHYPIQFLVSGTELAPAYFSLTNGIYKFFSQWVIAFLASFALTVLIDSPFSTIVKLALNSSPKKPHPQIDNVNRNQAKSEETPTTDL